MRPINSFPYLRTHLTLLIQCCTVGLKQFLFLQKMTISRQKFSLHNEFALLSNMLIETTT